MLRAGAAAAIATSTVVAAATYNSAEIVKLPPSIVQTDRWDAEDLGRYSEKTPSPTGKLKVYLAGPDCFAADASRRYDSMKKKAAACGLEAISPLDSEVNIHSPDILKTIFRINIQDIEEADVVLANVEAFRGTCVDDGTAFELGYAFAKAKKILVYTPDSTTPMKDRIAKELAEETKAKWLKKEEYPRLEDFPGCKNPGPVNLMITEAVRSTEGGAIAKSFDECIDLIVSQQKVCKV
jgi:nucleoside 2-deoxyribosyltransferase